MALIEKARQKLSRSSLRSRPSNISNATNSTSQSTATTRSTAAQSTRSRKSSSTHGSFRTLRKRGKLDKQRSIADSIRTIFTGRSHSPSEASEHTLTPATTPSTTARSSHTSSVNPTVQQRSALTTPQTGVAFQDIATGREEALARKRAEKESGKSKADMPPEIQRREDYNYTHHETPHAAAAEKNSRHTGGFAAKAGLFWTAMKAKLWLNKEERKIATIERKRILGYDGASDVETTVRDAVARKPIAVAPGKVAVRVRELEAQHAAEKHRQQHQQAIHRKPLGALAGDGSEVAVSPIYPLHVNRFIRRSSKGTPIRPETPLMQSSAAGTDYIAPQPTKSIPLLDHELGSTSPDHHHATIDAVLQIQNAAQNLPSSSSRSNRQIHSQALNSPAAYLHGTIDHCVRHGRKPTAITKSTKQGFSKSRLGTYVPTGFTQRRQTEATSPWHFPSILTRSNQGSDACPDCRAELHLKRREAIQSVIRPADVPKMPENIAMHGDSADRDSSKMLVLSDLGHGLDAVIFQHAGELQRVVLDKQTVRSSANALQKLSTDLLSVSQTLTTINADTSPPSVPSPSTKGRTLVLCTPTAQPRRQLVNELLDLVDKALCSSHGRQYNHVPAISAPIQQNDMKRLQHTLQAPTKRSTTSSPNKPAAAPYGNQSSPEPGSPLLLSTAHRPDMPIITTTSPSVPLPNPTSSQTNPTIPTQGQPSPRLIATPDLTPSLIPTPIITRVSTSTAPSPNPLLANKRLLDLFSTPLNRTIHCTADVLAAAAPYHHAPAFPRDLHVAHWADEKVKEMQREMRRVPRESLVEGTTVERRVEKEVNGAGKDVVGAIREVKRDAEKEVVEVERVGKESKRNSEGKGHRTPRSVLDLGMFGTGAGSET